SQSGRSDPSLLNPGMTTHPTSGITVVDPPSSSSNSTPSSSFKDLSPASGGDDTVKLRNSTHAKVHDMSSLPHSSAHNDATSSASLHSPCFVHSYLDKGVALGENLKKQRRQLSRQARSRSKGSRGSSRNVLSDATASADELGATAPTSPSSSQNASSLGTPSAALPIQPSGITAASDTGPSIQVSGPSVPARFASTHEEDTYSGSDATATDARRGSARGRIQFQTSSDEDDDTDDGIGAGDDADDHLQSGRSSSYGSSYSYSSGDEEDSDKVRSLTRQLAETAVGVREMSKQLGRARVKSTIQSVMIITKARDNHLIKLTRELAIWLMTTPRNGKDTGLIVYVDSQLKQSKRFDAEGIRRDHPQLFDCRPKRTPSMSSSLSSNASTHENGNSWGQRSEGVNNQLRYWNADMCSRSPHLFDFVVTLGGDGTVLFCSWLFQRIVPPVLPFALGSLGFLTNFDFKMYKKVMKSALDDGIRVNLRMRFTATVYRATLPSSSSADRYRRQAIKSGKTGEIIINSIKNCGWDAIESPNPEGPSASGSRSPRRDDVTAQQQSNDQSGDRSLRTDDSGTDRDDSVPGKKGKRGKKKCRDKEIMCFSTRPVETFEVLNDLVVDRGPSPYVSLLEVFGDEHHMTTAQADGLCISTPTGSTAYSLSAGGSLVHPEIPAILITPICPHTLSFRPMLLPDSMELRIAVPYNSRSTAWASFDGRGRVELKQGDHIKVTASRYPFPTVCAENQSTDWFSSISRTLKWNERQRQKSFVVVEEGADSGSGKDKENNKKVASQTFAKHAKNDDQSDDTDDDSDSSGDGDDDDSGEDRKKNKRERRSRSEADNQDDDEENEKFDIDDTSTTVTRSNSPSFHNHEGLVRRRSAPGTPRHGAGGSSRRSSGPGLLSSSNGIPRLTSITSTFPASGGGSGSGEAGNGGAHSAASSKPGSLLNSPDRFGLQGPPQPPKAISERHLLSADFRLDDSRGNVTTTSSSQPQDRSSSGSTRRQPGAGNSGPQGANAARSKPMTPSSALARSAAAAQPRSSPHSRSADAPHQSENHSFRKTARSSAERAAKSGPESAASSRGTALVVYGDDESDTDSTTGAG
ncbi:ATP-NAD kinase, partial [Testicularia cyperi]